MSSANFFSPSLSLVSIEKLISVELNNKQQLDNFHGLQESQRFFCDFLPVAAGFIYEFNSVRNELYSILEEDNSKKRNERVAECDARLLQAHYNGVEFIVKWARDYFCRSHHFIDNPRNTVTVTVRYFYQDDSSGGDVAVTVASEGPRRAEREIDVLKDASMVDFKYQEDGETEKKIGSFVCNDLIEWAVNYEFYHPSLKKENQASIKLVKDSYNSWWNKILWRTGKGRLTKSVREQWEACWTRSNASITSMCVFPITLANNTVSQRLKDALARSGLEFDSHEVFGTISLDSPDAYAFNVGDVLMARIWADALFTFAGPLTHYAYISNLRGQFGAVDLSDVKLKN